MQFFKFILVPQSMNRLRFNAFFSTEQYLNLKKTYRRSTQLSERSQATANWLQVTNYDGY